MPNPLTLLRQIAEASAAARTPEERVHCIVSGVRDSLNAAVCGLYLKSADDTLVLAAAEGLDSSAADGRSAIEIGRGLIGGIARNQKPVNLKRGEDIRNLGNRVAGKLSKTRMAQLSDGDEPGILIGTLVSIADISAYPIGRIAGIVCMEGSALSHSAVLAGALGIPAVMGVGAISELPEHAMAIVDGHQGRVLLSPAPEVIDEYRRLIDEEKAFDDEIADLKALPAVTPDGLRIQLFANTGLLADVSPGLARGAEGIGLYRSEIPFLIADSFPSEDEQFAIYRSVLEAYGEKPVHMRTLDVGGDKSLPYYPVTEENPALGWRGVRFTLDNSAVFMSQIRAMLRASEGLDNLRIILPMVTRVDEVNRFSDLLDSALDQLRQEGRAIARPPFGVMVEVPAAISILPFLGDKIDFVSIGSNDLSQYLLAVDRNNPRVSRLFDHLHPAVVRNVHEIVTIAHRLNLPVSLCGEMAAEPCAVVLLIGMGVNALSLSSFSLPKIKWLIRTVPQEEACEQLKLALEGEDEGVIRKQVGAYLAERGLGRLLGPVRWCANANAADFRREIEK